MALSIRWAPLPKKKKSITEKKRNSNISCQCICQCVFSLYEIDWLVLLLEIQIFLLPFHAYQAGTFPNTYIEIVQSHIYILKFAQN